MIKIIKYFFDSYSDATVNVENNHCKVTVKEKRTFNDFKQIEFYKLLLEEYQVILDNNSIKVPDINLEIVLEK